MPKLTPSEIYARQEAKQRKAQERAAKRALKAQERETRTSARAQIKRLDAMQRQQERVARQAQKEEEKKASRRGLRSYVPVYGAERTLSGAKLTPEQQKLRRAVRRKRSKATKRVVRRMWRRLI